jgi:RNA ligase
MIPALDKLNAYVADGLVTRVDQGPLAIFNYSKRCTYDHAWDPVTMTARGLVLNTRDGSVVALPFGKFFNHGEGDHGNVPEGPPDCVTIKLDGSLGISYRDVDGRLRWATRGTFFSEQALAGQDIWDRRYAHVDVPEEWTLLAEIIHPITRNVVRYDFDDLIILGIRNRVTGEDYSHAFVSEWCGSVGLHVVERVEMDYAAAAARALELDDQHEGFVLRWGDYRLKVKSAQYMKVARLISGLTDRAIADLWYAGIRSDNLPALPEETKMELDAEHLVLDDHAARLEQEAREVYEANRSAVDRKAFVLAVGSQHPRFGVAIQLFTGQRPDYRLAVYRELHAGRPRTLAVNGYGGWSFVGEAA